MHDLFSLIPLLFQATILGKCTKGMCANGQIDRYTNEGLMYKCLVPNRSIDMQQYLGNIYLAAITDIVNSCLEMIELTQMSSVCISTYRTDNVTCAHFSTKSWLLIRTLHG